MQQEYIKSHVVQQWVSCFCVPHQGPFILVPSTEKQLRDFGQPVYIYRISPTLIIAEVDTHTENLVKPLF